MEDNSTLNTHLNIHVGPELLRRVRAQFVAQGTSLQSWCRVNGVWRQNARKCLLGMWQGPKADQLISRLVSASQVRDG